MLVFKSLALFKGIRKQLEGRKAKADCSTVFRSKGLVLLPTPTHYRHFWMSQMGKAEEQSLGVLLSIL